MVLILPFSTRDERGDTLYLKQFADKEKEFDRDFWLREGLGVLGWSIRRAKDREEISKIIESVEEAAPVAENWIPVSLPELPEGERQCPEALIHQLQMFYEDVVSPLQRRTQIHDGRCTSPANMLPPISGKPSIGAF